MTIFNDNRCVPFFCFPLTTKIVRENVIMREKDRKRFKRFTSYLQKNIKTEFSMTIFDDKRCVHFFGFPLKAFKLF